MSITSSSPCPGRIHDRIVKLIQVCKRAGVEVSVVPDVFQLNLRQVLVENLDGIPLLRVNGYVPFKASSRLFKRALDLIADRAGLRPFCC